MTDIREAVARALYPVLVRGGNYDEVPIDEAFRRPRYQHLREQALSAADAALSVARPLIEAEALREAAKAAKTVDPSTFEHDGGIIADTVNDCVRAILSLLPTPTQEPAP